MKIRRPFRAVVYVAVIVAALGYIVLSAWCQPIWPNGTWIGNATARVFHKQLRFGPPTQGMNIARADGKWVPMWDGPLADTDWADSAGVVLLIRGGEPLRTGFWHPVYERDEISFSSLPNGEPFTDVDAQGEIIRAIKDADGRMMTPGGKSFFAEHVPYRRILWLGVLGDLSILSAFAAIIFSLVRLCREIRWRKPGHCAECNYDLAGLTVDKCPECGATVKASSSS